jgi:hypothetical protein
MIEVKQAIRSAFNFLKDIYKPVPHGLLLEEVASATKSGESL